MNEDKVQNFINSYLNFDIGIVFILGVVIFVCFLCIKQSQKKELTVRTVIHGIVWSLYLLILITGTMLNRKIGQDYNVNLTPFWSYEAVMEDGSESILWQMIYNVVMFIPWGILMSGMWECMQKPYWNIGSALLASVIIEVIQFIFKCGLVEFDDVFHNVLGGITGYGILCMYKEIKKLYER